MCNDACSWHKLNNPGEAVTKTQSRSYNKKKITAGKSDLKIENARSIDQAACVVGETQSTFLVNYVPSELEGKNRALNCYMVGGLEQTMECLWCDVTITKLLDSYRIYCLLSQ